MGICDGPRRKKSWKEGLMKCSNPAIAASVLSLIGAAGSASGADVQNVAAMHSWLMHQSCNKSGARQPIFEWLFLQPIENPQLRLKPAVVHIKGHYGHQ
jgi:hypothetical protein